MDQIRDKRGDLGRTAVLTFGLEGTLGGFNGAAEGWNTPLSGGDIDGRSLAGFNDV